jgi:hypothetical protein
MSAIMNWRPQNEETFFQLEALSLEAHGGSNANQAGRENHALQTQPEKRSAFEANVWHELAICK